MERCFLLHWIIGFRSCEASASLIEQLLRPAGTLCSDGGRLGEEVSSCRALWRRLSTPRAVASLSSSSPAVSCFERQSLASLWRWWSPRCCIWKDVELIKFDNWYLRTLPTRWCTLCAPLSFEPHGAACWPWEKIVKSRKMKPMDQR